MAGWPCPGKQIQRNEMTNEGKSCVIIFDILVMQMAIVGQIWKIGKLVDDFALIPHLI
jgi:hypothetical protein